MFSLAVGLECACFVWRPGGMKERGRLWCFCNDPPVEGVCSPFFLFNISERAVFFQLFCFLTHIEIYIHNLATVKYYLFYCLQAKAQDYLLPRHLQVQGRAERSIILVYSEESTGFAGLTILRAALRDARCEMFLCFFFLRRCNAVKSTSDTSGLPDKWSNYKYPRS